MRLNNEQMANASRNCPESSLFHVFENVVDGFVWLTRILEVT